MSAQQIIFDEEFKFFLPPLDSETYAALEADLLEHGVRDAIVLWYGVWVVGVLRHLLFFDKFP